MKAQHTPGPWNVCENAPSLIEADIGHEDGLPRIIAQAFDPIPHIGTATVNANARLIAASPQMLAELEKVEKLLLAISATDYPVSDELTSVQCAIVAARGSYVPVHHTGDAK